MVLSISLQLLRLTAAPVGLWFTNPSKVDVITSHDRKHKYKTNIQNKKLYKYNLEQKQHTILVVIMFRISQSTHTPSNPEQRGWT